MSKARELCSLGQQHCHPTHVDKDLRPFAQRRVERLYATPVGFEGWEVDSLRVQILAILGKWVMRLWPTPAGGEQLDSERVKHKTIKDENNARFAR